MEKLDGIVVPVIMALVLSAGVAAAVMLTRTGKAETAIEVEPPRLSGVLKPQGSVRLRTRTAASADGSTTRGFKKPPTSE